MLRLRVLWLVLLELVVWLDTRVLLAGKWSKQQEQAEWPRQRAARRHRRTADGQIGTPEDTSGSSPGKRAAERLRTVTRCGEAHSARAGTSNTLFQGTQAQNESERPRQVNKAPSAGVNAI
ncbi:hypothetical protein GCM10010302_07440 [Streptomyces polychromogenes]|uniref:Secreted protein n=1 Tax=Streptomyces polychromogenes TaxID=67342 RepID=A0ABN0V2P9_9ACTN